MFNVSLSKKAMLTLVLSAILITSNFSSSLLSHGEEAGQGEGLNLSVFVPYVQGVQPVNGLVNQSLYPEEGHLENEDLGISIMLKHNGTHLIAGLIYESNGFGGFGLRISGLEDHDNLEEDPLFVFFLADVNNGSTFSNVILTHSDFDDVEENITSEFDLNAVGSEDMFGTQLEFIIPMYDNSLPESGDHEKADFSDYLPRTGYLFNIIMVFSSQNDFNQTSSVTVTNIYLGYILRPGENPEDILKLFERKPDLASVVLVPILFIASIILLVWRYSKFT